MSRNNAFLIAVGLVEGGRQKTVTPLGRNLARALEHDVADEVANLWRQTATENEFFQKVLAAVRIRRGMDAPTLQAHVAYSAGEKKTPRVVAGAAAVIQIMVVAGLLVDEGGKYAAADNGPSAEPKPMEEVTVQDSVVAKLTAVTPSVASRTVQPERTAASAVTVQLQLRVDCKVDELDLVAVKLRNLIETLAQPVKAESPAAGRSEQPTTPTGEVPAPEEGE